MAVEQNYPASGEICREMELMENWNARIGRLFVGGSSGCSKEKSGGTQFAEDTSDVVFKVQLDQESDDESGGGSGGAEGGSDGQQNSEVLFKVCHKYARNSIWVTFNQVT